MSSKTLILSSSGLKNVIVNQSDNEEFSFIFSKESITIPRIFAEFLSPKVCKLHKTDQTIQSINFSDEMKDLTISRKALSKIKLLSMGESIDVNEEEIFELQIISILLENEELFIKIKDQFDNEIKEDNLDQQINKLTILDKITEKSNFFNYSSIIEFISKQFYLIDKEKLFQLSKGVLYSIICNEELRIESEDSLFDFIIQFFDIHKEDKKEEEENDLISFLEQIYFENLSEEKLSQFLDNFNVNDMTVGLWLKLRPCIHINKNNSINSRYKSKTKIIEYDGNTSHSLNGIIDYLTKKCCGNVSDKGTVKVTTNSERLGFEVKNAVDLHNNENRFASDNVSNVWVKYDFIRRKICPTCYTIKSRNDYDGHHPRSWVIEGSNTDEESDWKILDQKENDGTIHGRNACYTFNINNNKQGEYYRYLRIRQTGKNSDERDYFTFSGLEYFGEILKDS
ncbi:hypothetical protein M9Y10_042674 [Tritrichomonas musculus]|uniref:BACK domain-containing protein n=1 Tax=Tritrichomonas musculus TaxID=1915356 RepID=A0ABR2K0D7_9EUKA